MLKKIAAIALLATGIGTAQAQVYVQPYVQIGVPVYQPVQPVYGYPAAFRNPYDARRPYVENRWERRGWGDERRWEHHHHGYGREWGRGW